MASLSAECQSLLTLQSKVMVDPESYESELSLIYGQFKSSVDLFRQQAAMSYTSFSGISADPKVSKDLADRAAFLSHMTPFYPKKLATFPAEIFELLRSSGKSLPSGLRSHLAQALILLINREVVDIQETLDLFIELQTLGDKELRKLAFSHVVHSIKRLNQKHKNEAKNRPLQNIMFSMLQQEDESRAKRALVTLCELHRRKVWFDEQTANAICTACFHSTSRIMIASLSFLLDYEKLGDEDDSDADRSEDEASTPQAQLILSRQSIYKAHSQGTSSSKKKKKAKLERAIHSMKKKQRLSSEKTDSNSYSPLNHLEDPQGFVEKLFSRLQTCNERFEVKMMILKVIARTIGLHRLLLLNFYPYLQKYAQPHQRDVTTLLAAAVQACHDMVPPDAVEPLFKQIVNQFVHDRSRTESIAVGLNVVREICLRIPLLMSEDLLQDLALYKKSHEKAVSVAARSLIGLFREICPSLLIKKDRGRPTNPTARPKAYGEVSVPSNVSGAELLEEDENESENGDDVIEPIYGDDHDDETVASDGDGDETVASEEEDDDSDGDVRVDEDEDDNTEKFEEDEMKITDDLEAEDDGSGLKVSSKKRKLSDFEEQLVNADTSLCALKKLAGSSEPESKPDASDGFLSNEDFQRINELKAKKAANLALNQHGLLRKKPDANKSTAFHVPSSDQLTQMRVDPDKLRAHIRKKMTKEERLTLVRAGREDRGKYQAKAAVKQNKTGGSSNKQKERRKALPLAVKRSKIAKSRIDKKKRNAVSGKQFRGKKAWK